MTANTTSYVNCDDDDLVAQLATCANRAPNVSNGTRGRVRPV